VASSSRQRCRVRREDVRDMSHPKTFSTMRPLLTVGCSFCRAVDGPTIGGECNKTLRAIPQRAVIDACLHRPQAVGRMRGRAGEPQRPLFRR
jgi:hypothetical protein